MNRHAEASDRPLVTGIGVAVPATDEPGRLLSAYLGRTAERFAPTDASWFDVATRLGPRGYRHMPPGCHYLLGAARQALADAGDCLGWTTEAERAVAVGTNSGIAALHAQMNETVATDGSDQLSPALAPFFSINVLAGRLSIEQAIRGFNLTMNTPLVAGLEAVQVGSRGLGAGRANLLLAGAVEAPVPAGTPAAGRAEAGAVILAVEPVAVAARRGATGYGSCTARTMFLPPDAARGVAGRRDAVAEFESLLSGLSTEPITDWYVFAADEPVGSVLTDAVRRVGADRVALLPPGAGCLGPMAAIAGFLAGEPGQHGVAVASAEGHLAVALVECWGTWSAADATGAAGAAHSAGPSARITTPTGLGRH
jgi:3-oxoacyl-[acyl-carrier-protein] synthase II